MKTFRYAMLSLVIAFMLTVIVDAHAYIRGPRGGCYTLSASGAKRYIDRSLCDGQEPTSQATTLESTRSSLSSGYIRGPRGGCYTVTASGNKRYVNRSLCQ